MQELNELVNNNLLWTADCGRDCGALDAPSERPEDVLAEGMSHEFFVDYSDHLVKLPPTSLVVSYLKDLCIPAWSAHDQKRLVICIGRDVWPTPYFLRDCFRDSSCFDNFLFVNPSSEAHQLKALETALRSESVVAVLTSCKKLSFAFTQKVFLLAKSSNAKSFIFRDSKDIRTKSSAYSRWLVTPTVSNAYVPSWKMSLLSTKGAQINKGDWIVELSNEQAISMRLFPELVDQPGTETPARARYA